MRLLNNIKDEYNLYRAKLEQNDLRYIMEAEKKLIRHLSWIKSIFAEHAQNKKMLQELQGKKKLKAKEMRLRNDLIAEITVIEREWQFLEEDYGFIKELMLKSSRLLWEKYSHEHDIPHTFDEIIGSEKNLKFYYNQGIINTYKIRFVPKVLSDDIRKAFPDHPKDEFTEARAMHRQFYIHEGGTNSGKTYSSIMRLMSAESGLYLAPLRLLALEIFDRLNANNVPCHLKTGEEEIIIPAARHTSSTVEKVDLQHDYEVVVIDEAQMLADVQRGAAWTRAILGVRAKEVHICCALHATEIVKKLVEDCGDSWEVITHIRDTELTVERDEFRFPSSVKDGDALIVFSRRSVLTAAAALEEKNISCSMIYGSLPPETRRMQFEKFLSKENKVLVSTDAIGMGVNLPIKRVVFLEKDKYDGIKERPLYTSEIKQIAGRAGRKGIYDQGFVNTIYQEEKKQISHALTSHENPIEKAFLAPTEDILKVDGELETKLKVWASIDPIEEFYEKINVDRLINLISIIKQMGIFKRITQEEVFKCINIPFDEDEDAILYLWKDYVRIIAKDTDENTLFKPSFPEEELLNLEIYYRKIDLYYSFAKTFNMDMDEVWVKEERRRVAKLIDKHLKERIRRYKKHCRACGTPLPWNFMFPLCDRCHSLKVAGMLDEDDMDFGFEDLSCDDI
ncbi:helicase-related protein [Clostridium thermarum]|uniref:helicase-related protein n=1 Tax=Clostridium thermarum TaxID=1716543 RepID=UPI001120F9DA|nr:helicase-related protein [Clostridium thermarum]